MIRTFKYYPIVAGGTPQPLVGTTLSAAVQASDKPIELTVPDSSIFDVGGYAVLDVPGALEERQMVTRIRDATHITVNMVAFAHASGARIRPSRPVNSVYVQSKDGNAAPLYIGTSALVIGTGVGVVAKIVQVAAGSQPTEWGQSVGGQIGGIDIANYWIDGTTNDNYLPSCVFA